ncbi:MAG TPA: hypothetical protein VGL02_01440 [Streptomyces sp.]
MTSSLADPVADVLGGFGVAEQAATEAGRWLQELIDDARRGWSEDCHRAVIVEHLRHACGCSTATALAALDRIEQDVFGGARVPATDVRDRFCATRSSVWDRELNRHWCHDCRSWTGSDVHVELLGPLWCPCGARLVP